MLSDDEPSPGCSNWREQPPNSARKLDSSDSGEELEDHQTPRSSRLKNLSNEKSNEGEKKEAKTKVKPVEKPTIELLAISTKYLSII